MVEERRRRINALEMRFLRNMCGASSKDRCRDSDGEELCGLKEDVVIRVLAVAFFVTLAQCQEHSHSYKTVIKHEAPKKVQSHHSHSYEPVKEQHHAIPVVQSHGHDHATSSQSISSSHESSHQGNHGHHQSGPSYYFVPVKHSAPVHHEPVKHQSSHKESHHEDYYAHPKYTFEYKVEDPHTGDNKYQHESRDGDVVKGVYSLHQPDGSIRIVEYNSDKHTGFNAYVKHSAPSKHIEPQSHHHH
ncbi:Cuticle protein 19 [Eumeta japonica]|uniref:Cuticle protein 19 n=1 Tax=Eumeta variegata TaxID=151549 RepID=A0A4C1WXS9_EUMVA|nr:Cuticle protein 19 [Eumeta japonica]